MAPSRAAPTRRRERALSCAYFPSIHPARPTRCADYWVGLPAGDLVDRALVQRDEEQVAVRRGLDVGDDPEVRADEQAFALGEVELVVVVGDPVGQPRVVDADLPAVPGQVEVEQVPAGEEGAGGADEQVPVELGSQPAAGDEADGARGDLEPPAELRQIGR